MSRFVKSAEKFVRHALVYPLLRLWFRNETFDMRIDIKTIKKILVLRADGIGDMIVSTPMLRRLKEANPLLELAVFASPRNEEIIRHNPFVDRIYLLYHNWWNLAREIMRARRAQYDVVINFVFNRTTVEGILANIVCPRGLKIGQGLEKYRFYFNRLLSIDHTSLHMVEILAGMLETVFELGMPRKRLEYEIVVDDADKRMVDVFLEKKGLVRNGGGKAKGGYLVLNFSAIDEVRRLSVGQVLGALRHIAKVRREQPVLICPSNDSRRLAEILKKSGETPPLVYPETGVATLLELASLIEGANYVITPDTSIVHFASATKTPLLALYTPTAARNHQWMPQGVFYRSLRTTEGKPVSAITLREIESGLDEFFKAMGSKPRRLLKMPSAVPSH